MSIRGIIIVYMRDIKLEHDINTVINKYDEDCDHQVMNQTTPTKIRRPNVLRDLNSTMNRSRQMNR